LNENLTTENNNINEEAAGAQNTENNAENNAENAIGNAAESTQSGLGKFSDAQSLLNAYNALQTEFTKKCQELSALKSGEPPKQFDEEFIQRILGNKDITDRVIGEYLRQLSGGRAPVTISGSYGAIPYMPPKKPRTLAEAASMAQKLMENI
jgi:hypothetical protein